MKQWSKLKSKMCKLQELHNNANKIRSHYSMISNIKNDKLKYKLLCDYYVVAEEYHNTKMWFMKDLKIITK